MLKDQRSDIVILGITPSKRKGDCQSIKRLYKILDEAGVSYFTFHNVMPSPDDTVVDDVALRIALEGKSKIVALGNLVSNVLTKRDIQHYNLGHPSGLNRSWNHPPYREGKILKLREYLNA